MKSFFKTSLTLLLVLFAFQAKSQIELKDIATRAMDAQFIFEGTVIKSKSYTPDSGKTILTSNTIEISKIFKGDLQCGTVEIITLGGNVGKTATLLSHNLTLRTGMMGIFLCNSTSREESPIDFYTENNPVKLQVGFNQQGYIKYLDDNINKLIIDYKFQLDSLAAAYGMMELLTQINYTDCNPGESIFQNNNFNQTSFIPYDKSQDEFPHYDNAKGAQIISSKLADKKIHSREKENTRSTSTLTYKMSNITVTGSTQKYAEFDVSIFDNQGTGYLDQSCTRIKYNTSVFGDSVVQNNAVMITAAPLIADTTAYAVPYALDLSPDAIYVLADEHVYSQNKVLVPTAAVKLFHVKMKIQNCIPPSNIKVEDTALWFGDLMLSFSAYADFPNDTFQTYYDGIVANENKVMPPCTLTINSITPPVVNGGVGDTVTVSGIKFGATQGNGGIFLRNSDDGGQTYLSLDPTDYVSWSDTLIKFIVPSIVDSSSSPINTQATPGTGYLKIKTNTGDTTTFLTSPLTIHFAVSNFLEIPSPSPRHKYLNMLDDYWYTHNGYIFHPDTSFSNHPDRMECLAKAVHDWVCLTNVNFQIGSDTIMPNPLAPDAYDHINLISFGHLDDSGIVARTSQHLFFDSTCLAYGIEHVREIDLIVNEDKAPLMWCDTVAAHNVQAGKFDLYEVLLHELGHAISNWHVNDSTKVMWWESSKGEVSANRRIRLFYDSPAHDNGTYTVTESQNPGIAACGVLNMPLLYLGDCPTFQNGIATLDNNSSNFSVYPNPTTDGVTVSYKLPTNATVTLSVFDNLGRIIYSSETVKQSIGNYNLQLQTTTWTNGLYLIQLSVNGNYNYQKLIRQ